MTEQQFDEGFSWVKAEPSATSRCPKCKMSPVDCDRCLEYIDAGDVFGCYGDGVHGCQTCIGGGGEE